MSRRPSLTKSRSRREPAARPSAPPGLVKAPGGYAQWLRLLKAQIGEARRRAIVSVNSELVLLYWWIGRDILERQRTAGWGAKVIEKLAHDLLVAFPDMQRHSRANLLYMRAFAEAWPDESIVQQLVGRLAQLVGSGSRWRHSRASAPWGVGSWAPVTLAGGRR